MLSEPEIMFRVAPVTVQGGVFLGAMDTGSWMTGPDGQPCAGSLGVLADVALGYPVVSASAGSQWAISIELALDFCAPLPRDGQPLRTESSVVALGPSGGLTQARILGASGTLLATGKQRMRFTSFGRPWPAGDTPAAPPPGGPPREGSTLNQLRASLTRTPDGATLALPGRDAVLNPMGNLHGRAGSSETFKTPRQAPH